MNPTISYDYAVKNHWRRTKWNLITKRFHGDRKNALILYLPAIDDLDRPEAIKRGFKDHNLIAIETDSEIVKKLRKNKTYTIQGPLRDVVDSWPSHTPIAVIDADFMNGFTADNANFVSDFFWPKDFMQMKKITWPQTRARFSKHKRVVTAALAHRTIKRKGLTI